MRELAVVALLGFFVACSNTAETAPPPAITPATRSPSTTSSLTTTSTATTSTTTTPPSTTTTTRVDGPPVVDMVPAGYDIEDFIPLVEGYFAVRNWALEHPDQVTEEILATVIQPGSVEMRDTLAEIQDLLDQDAHYEGLTETFVLVTAYEVTETTDTKAGKYSAAMTLEYGDTSLASSSDEVIATDTLRRDAWTLHFARQDNGQWVVTSILRNPTMHAPGGG